MTASLLGRTVAITRGPDDAAEFVEVVGTEGGRAVPLPTIRLVGRGDKISEDYLRASAEYDPDHTVFMSSKAARLLFDDAAGRSILEEVRLAVANTNVVSVGPKTARVLEGYGIRTNAMPESVYSSVGVGEVFGRLDRSRNRVLVPRSGASTPFLRELLGKMGFDVRDLHLYDVQPHPGGPEWERFAGMLSDGRIDGMIFTSASSVRAFFEIMAGVTGYGDDAAALLGRASAVVSIGPFTSEELDRMGVAHHLSSVHTVAGSLDALRDALAGEDGADP